VKPTSGLYFLRWQSDGCELCNRRTGELNTVLVSNGRLVGRCDCMERPPEPWVRCDHQDAVLRRLMDKNLAASFARWRRANPWLVRTLAKRRGEDLDEEDPNFEINPLSGHRYEVRDRRKPEAHVLHVSAGHFVGRCDCGIRGGLPLFMCPHRLALRAYLVNRRYSSCHEIRYWRFR